MTEPTTPTATPTLPQRTTGEAKRTLEGAPLTAAIAEVDHLRRCLVALYLQVPLSVANDISLAVEAVISDFQSKITGHEKLEVRTDDYLKQLTHDLRCTQKDVRLFTDRADTSAAQVRKLEGIIGELFDAEDDVIELADQKHNDPDTWTDELEENLNDASVNLKRAYSVLGHCVLDKCEVCQGKRGCARGEEFVVNGVTVCCACHALVSPMRCSDCDAVFTDPTGCPCGAPQ